MKRPTVAVVGAGFSGLLTALHLLADPDGPIVRLIERRGVFGRGVAYASPNPEHRLNVRAGNMSAFPDDPDHFVRWLSQRADSSADEGFVTRRIYGDYLQSLLRRAAGEGGQRLLLEADEAVDLEPDGPGWTVLLAVGRRFAADAVVLALGSPSSAPPAGASPEVLASPRYVADPWALASDADLGERVLLLGSGLTMVDVALSHAAPGRSFIALSRRGLTPRAHVSGDVGPGAAARPEGSPLALLRQFRRETVTLDWRRSLDAWRPHVQAIWADWSDAQRLQALRHLGAWWNVHRHRMAPGVSQDLDQLMANGKLTIHAGRVQSLTLAPSGFRLVWKPRSEASCATLEVDAVINCTGPGGDLNQGYGALTARLVARGLIRPAPSGLGAAVDDQARLIDRVGLPNLRLFAVGPLTRGTFFEVTAAPDIRMQAEQVAARIAAALSDRRGWVLTDPARAVRRHGRQMNRYGVE